MAASLLKMMMKSPVKQAGCGKLSRFHRVHLRAGMQYPWSQFGCLAVNPPVDQPGR
jgi:hypothetical protein